MSNYEEARTEIAASLLLGIDVEADDAQLAEIVGGLTNAQVEWISAWLAGEGFTRGGAA